MVGKYVILEFRPPNSHPSADVREFLPVNLVTIPEFSEIITGVILTAMRFTEI
jgi:hypothetical protein